MGCCWHAALSHVNKDGIHRTNFQLGPQESVPHSSGFLYLFHDTCLERM